MTAKQSAKKQQQNQRAKRSETPESELSEDEQDPKRVEDAAASDESGVADEAPAADDAARLAELEAEVAKLKDQLLRALAELENTRRRAERERQDAAKYAAVPLARDLLAVADNLRRALENAPKASPAKATENEEALTQFLSGVEMTEKELQDALAKHGIERIEPDGEKFDPHWHEAMFEVPTADAEPGTVIQVVQTGYRLDERLLRPARVGVARKA